MHAHADATVSLIYLLCLLFDEVHIVKPYRSRIVNSERYIVAKGMCPRESPLFQAAVATLSQAHARASDDMSVDTVVKMR